MVHLSSPTVLHLYSCHLLLLPAPPHFYSVHHHTHHHIVEQQYPSFKIVPKPHFPLPALAYRSVIGPSSSLYDKSQVPEIFNFPIISSYQYQTFLSFCLLSFLNTTILDLSAFSVNFFSLRYFLILFSISILAFSLSASITISSA